MSVLMILWEITVTLILGWIDFIKFNLILFHFIKYMIDCSDDIYF